MCVMADMIGNREALDGIYLEATLSSLALLPRSHQQMLSGIFCSTRRARARGRAVCLLLNVKTRMKNEARARHRAQAGVTISGGPGRFVRIDGFRCPDTNVRLLITISGRYRFYLFNKIK